MKLLLSLLFLLMFVGCSTGRGPASFQDEVQHIVFDIDWTIVAETETPNLFPANRVVVVEGKHYVKYFGLESLVEKLIRNPQIKISFYSGGKKARNEDLLKKIKLNDGRSLFSVAHKILSAEDLTPMPNTTAEMKFSERFKKDLTKVSEDLEQVLMFDDTPKFVLPGKAKQEEQVFHMGLSYLPFRDFNDAIGAKGDYIPPNREAWLLDSQRLIILEQVFNEAFAELQNGENVTLAQLMKQKEKLLRFDLHQWNQYSKIYYNRSLPTAESCFKLIPAFF